MTPQNSESKTVEIGIQANDDARSGTDALYTPLDEALVLLRECRSDVKLRASVAEFHRDNPPTFLPDKPCALLGRHIATPNREFELFASMMESTGLQPLCTEYTGDTFSSRNADKLCLCRPKFEMQPNHFRGLHIMSSGGISGKKLCDLRLANGMTLPAFHHALLHHAFPGFDRHRVDYSEWFSIARREEYFYLHYLALFICDGILFENFLANDPEELCFARERVLPSFTKAIELFGVKPLIVPLLPRETEGDDRWRSYRGDLHPFARNLLHGKG